MNLFLTSLIVLSLDLFICYRLVHSKNQSAAITAVLIRHIDAFLKYGDGEGRETIMGESYAICPGLCVVCSRTWERLALPLPLSDARWRYENYFTLPLILYAHCRVLQQVVYISIYIYIYLSPTLPI